MKSVERGATSPKSNDEVLSTHSRLEQAASLSLDRAAHAALHYKNVQRKYGLASKSPGIDSWREKLGGAVTVGLHPFGSDDEQDEGAGIA